MAARIDKCIKGCRVKRRPEEDANVGLTVGFHVRVMGLRINTLLYIPFLFI